MGNNIVIIIKKEELCQLFKLRTENLPINLVIC